MTEYQFVKMCEKIDNIFLKKETHVIFSVDYRRSWEKKINKDGIELSIWAGMGLFEAYIYFKPHNEITAQYLNTYHTYKRLKGERVYD